MPSDFDADPGDARALLEFYLEAGIDCALSEEPVDRFVESRNPRPAMMPAMPAESRSPTAIPVQDAQPVRGAQQAPQTSRGQPPVARAPQAGAVSGPAAASGGPKDAAVMAAREAARQAHDLDSLRQTLETFEGCSLRFTAKNLVFADGSANARVMMVGEAPGRDEDIQGVPFVGRSGRLLDRMLEAIGLAREDVYIANVVPWRPPGNRMPSPTETEICRPFIERQIELVDPDILVLLGGASAKQLLGTSQGILKLCGKWHGFSTGKREIRAIATLHPAYLLRQPLEKRLAWRDFLSIKAALEEGR
ncbi:MAG: uracil-DNA glycosylase [Hyphomicrobiales bacterium]|nr:MAG: uracil-DNA glycosylase [Hyphomicrobiales bacterium]